MKPVDGFPAGPGEYPLELPDGGIAVVQIAVLKDGAGTRIRARAWKAEPSGRRSVTPRGTAIMLPERWREVPQLLRDENKIVNEVTDVIRKVYDELVAHIDALNSVPVRAADLMRQSV